MKKLLGLISVLLIFSCDDIVGIEDISNDDVLIVAPAEGSILDTLTPTFSWDVLEGADNYHLQIATPSFEAATQVIIDTTVTSTNFTQALSLGDYQWRIRGENTEYQSLYTTQNFSIEEED